MSAIKIKKGDTVRVIAGKDKNKEGKVLSVDSKKGKIIVENVNMLTKHTKPNAQNQTGGIINQEGPKVEDGKKVRVAKATGKTID